ncbi:Rha family transcriptional regulator [Pseudoxanthomonas sp. X-1]|nr:Rha family transcriptional regulator [Pseudoxanthomonas sp. X-1]
MAENTDNEHASVIKLVRTYLTDLEEFGLVRFEIRPRSDGQHGGGDTEYAELNEQQSTLLLTYMRNSDTVRFFKKRLVRAFFDMRQRLIKPQSLSPAEMLLQMAQLNLEHERRLAATEQQQAVQANELHRIDAKLEQVAESNVWTSRPSNAEGITHIVKRLGAKYGLSAGIIHEVMRQAPFTIKPAGMVRNEHESAKGATYAVYWVADVNKVFARFVSECKRVSATQCSHPYVKGRFKLNRELEGQMPFAS